MRNKKPDDDKECFCGEDASQALRDRLMSRGADGEDDFLFMSCVQSALRCNVEELDLDIGHGRTKFPFSLYSYCFLAFSFDSWETEQKTARANFLFRQQIELDMVSCSALYLRCIGENTYIKTLHK